MKITVSLDEENKFQLLFKCELNKEIKIFKLNMKEQNLSQIDELFDIIIEHIENIELIKEIELGESVSIKAALIIFDKISIEIKKIKEEAENFKIF